MKTRFTRVALAVWFIIQSGHCLGQGTIYFDRGDFEFAIAGLSGIRRDLDFQGPLPPGDYFPPLTISGLTFRGGGPQLIYQMSADGNLALINYDSLAPQIVDMNGPALAFGADFASFISPDYTSFLATVTLNDGSFFTFIAPADPNFTFFGIVTTQPFYSLTFSDGGLVGTGLHEEILDNITVVTIPEPGALGLFALGGLLLVWRFLKPIHSVRRSLTIIQEPN
jgi:hypothetical protein